MQSGGSCPGWRNREPFQINRVPQNNVSSWESHGYTETAHHGKRCLKFKRQSIAWICNPNIYPCSGQFSPCYCLHTPSDGELTTSKRRHFSCQRAKTKCLSFLKTNASCQAEQGESLLVLVKDEGSGLRLGKSQLHFSVAVCYWTSTQRLWACFVTVIF